MIFSQIFFRTLFIPLLKSAFLNAACAKHIVYLQPKFVVMIDFDYLGGMHRLDDVWVRLWTDVNGTKLTYPDTAQKIIIEQHRKLPYAIVDWEKDSMHPVSRLHLPHKGSTRSRAVLNTLSRLLLSIYPIQFKATHEERPTADTLLIEFFTYYGMKRINLCVDVVATAGPANYSSQQVVRWDVSLGLGIFINQPPMFGVFAYIKPPAVTHCPDFVWPNFSKLKPIRGMPLEGGYWLNAQRNKTKNVIDQKK